MRYTANVPSQVARIARTVPDTIFIDNSNTSFQIVSKTSWPVVGLVLGKVGRTTGWTSGTVTNTCMNINKPSNRGLICQSRFERPAVFGLPLAAEGDSGAPVFRWLGGDNVSLYGILHSGGDTYGLFSPMTNIEGELGVLTVTP